MPHTSPDPLVWRDALEQTRAEAAALLQLAQALAGLEGGATPSAQAATLMHAARDVGRQAAQLLGYFDGFAARARVGERLERLLAPGPDAHVAPALIGELHTVAARSLLAALDDLLDRPTLALAADGPRRPGVERTCAWLIVGLRRTGALLRALHEAQSAKAEV